MRELVAAIAYHAALGLVLAALVWAVGLGLYARMRPGPLGRLEASFAYPIGLLAVTAAAFLSLVRPWLGVVGLLFLVVGLAIGFSERRRAAPLMVAATSRIVAGLAPLVGFSAALGFLLHGPSSNLDSRAYGDLVFFVAKLVSATKSVLPFRDLLAEGQRSVYLEGGSTYVGAALARLPGFDPFLFQTTTLSAFMLASLLGSFGAILGDRHRQTPMLVAVAPFAVAMVAYPTWITVSPPVMLVLPLAFAIFALATEPLSTRAFLVLSGIVALDVLLTKGFALVPFALVLAVAFRRDHWNRLGRRSAPIALAGVGVAVALGLAFFLATSGWLTSLLRWNHIPADAVHGLRSQLDTRSTRELAPAAEILGHTALAVALFRARAYALAGAMTVSMLGTWFVGGEGFDLDIAAGITILLAAIRFASRSADLARARGPVVLAGLFLAVSAVFRETMGVRVGFALVALLGLTLLVMVAPPLGGTIGRFAPVLAAVGAAALLVLAATVPGSDTLASADYDIWREVHAAVPRDGLVFTSLTGPAVTGDQGWNYYPGVADRQLYLGGWYDSVLLARSNDRQRRLRLNADVIAGRREPRSLKMSRRYSTYFAVLRYSERAPASFRRVYGNKRYVLYRIES